MALTQAFSLRLLSLALGVAAGLALAARGETTAAFDGRASPIDEAYLKEVGQWRAKHEADYRREYVPLAGLFFLEQGPNQAGSAGRATVKLPRSAPARIGRFVLNQKTVRFEPKPGVTVKLKGRGITSPIELKADDAQDGPDELSIGRIALWVHLSGERPTVRMRDPDGEPAKSFHGFQWFPISEQYRVTARFIKDPAPQELQIPNLLGDIDTMTTEGVVEFSLENETIRLRPMTTRPGRLWFIFRDGTSGKETYEVARFLYADLRDDGTAILDFNEAYNPPCAFNPFTTCPLTLPENRLRARILAGERGYH